MPHRLSVALTCLALAAAGLGGGCRHTDDARVLQVLNQRGFGRATRDANRQYYIGIGDTLVMRDSLHVEYNGVVEAVRMDGVITLPDVGEVYVNSLTPEEATQAVRERYSDYVLDTDGISIEVTSIQSKRYYIARLPPNDPLALEFRGDITLLDALLQANIDEILVDTDEILVIRGDPENPLIITCNYDDITRRGLTRDNIQIVENDIVYLTPSVIGWVTYGVDVLISPIKPIRDLLLGSSQIVATSESFGQTGKGYGNNNYNNNNY